MLRILTPVTGENLALLQQIGGIRALYGQGSLLDRDLSPDDFNDFKAILINTGMVLPANLPEATRKYPNKSVFPIYLTVKHPARFTSDPEIFLAVGTEEQLQLGLKAILVKQTLSNEP